MSSAMSSLHHLIAFLTLFVSLGTSARADVDLMVYDFNLGGTPAANADQVRSIGFEGIVTSVATAADLAKLQAYADHAATLQDFRVLAYVYHDFNVPGSTQLWSQALPILAQAGAPLWVIVKHAPSEKALVTLLHDMARGAQLVGVEAVIYPHWNTSIEDAAEASALISEVGHANLRSSLHTCHEIRAGNQYGLPGVVAAHASETALVTIAGADDKAYAGPFPVGGVPWSDAIRPLDEGGFRLTPFLQALEDAGYAGPVVLHTYGIVNDPGHLRRSLQAYAKYRAEVH